MCWYFLGDFTDDERRPKKKRKRIKKNKDGSGSGSDDEVRTWKRLPARFFLVKTQSAVVDSVILTIFFQIPQEKASGSGSGDENESPTKGGRKDIRKIIKDKKLSKSTKTAAQQETDRRKRVADKQALFNELVEIKENAVVEALPLDIDPDSKEVLVTVAPALCQKLKPHQARGKFIHKIVEKTKYISFNLQNDQDFIKLLKSTIHRPSCE